MVFELDMGVGDWAMAAAVWAGESRLLFFGLRGCCRYVYVVSTPGGRTTRLDYWVMLPAAVLLAIWLS